MNHTITKILFIVIWFAFLANSFHKTLSITSEYDSFSDDNNVEEIITKYNDFLAREVGSVDDYEESPTFLLESFF